MNMMNTAKLIDWLMETAGPVIRYRTLRDIISQEDCLKFDALRQRAYGSNEAQKWLGLLNGKNPLHHSKDIAFENITAKLGLYGLDMTFPEVALMIPRYLDLYCECLRDDSINMCLVSSLALISYTDSSVEAVVTERIDTLHNTARQEMFKFLKSDAEKADIPDKWHSKPIFREELGSAIPSAYDLLMLSLCKQQYPALSQKIERIVEYILDPRFQCYPSIIYAWRSEKRYCHSTVRPKIPCFQEESTSHDIMLDAYSRPRLLLYLYIMSHFSCTFSSPWYRSVLAHLTTFKTEMGTYIFPSEYLNEKPNGYFLYAGSHMGLGENRKHKIWREIESTFWMLWLQKQEERLWNYGDD